jgi:2-keto-4-pentenoate hydratase/2-oxohepta-3-ene-1,7-dioic acid hydratase in catechol pathway
MKYCRFLLNGQSHYGTVEDRSGELWIAELAEAPEEDLAFRLEHGRATALGLDFEPVPLSSAQLLPPVTPSKIICVGRNYRAHVREMGGGEMPTEPLIFFKPPSALLSPEGVVKLPRISTHVDYEGELALVIGRRASKIRREEWRAYVRGCTLANDVSARDLQKNDGQWTRAKGCDTFCPVGPLVTSEIDLDAGVTIETRLNGEVRQKASTLDFIFPVPVLLDFITAAMTLEPGDLILTGTPAGVGQIKAGDRVEVSARGLGVLRNTVAAGA